jgi:cold shock CspA family protein
MATGMITKINTELLYGFIAVKGSDDVFFSTETKFNNTTLLSLRVGDKVNFESQQTERGLFATSLSVAPVRSKSAEPEASI